MRSPLSEPRRPILISSPTAWRLDGSPTTQACRTSPRAFSQSSTLMVPLTLSPSSSPVMSSEIEPGALPPPASRIALRGGDEAGDLALHIDGAAPVEHAIADLRGERRRGPRVDVARRHDVGVAGKAEIGPGVAEPRIEVLDVRESRLARMSCGGTRSRRQTSTPSSSVSAPPSTGVTLSQRISAWASATGSEAVVMPSARLLPVDRDRSDWGRACRG